MEGSRWFRREYKTEHDFTHKLPLQLPLPIVQATPLTVGGVRRGHAQVTVHRCALPEIRSATAQLREGGWGVGAEIHIRAYCRLHPLIIILQSPRVI